MSDAAKVTTGGALAAVGVPASGHLAALAQATPGEGTPMANQGEMYKQSPWWPWLSAHVEDENPPDVVGGPITTSVSQESGPSFWILPSPRKLDPTIFGTADDPKGTELPSLFLGVPPDFRETLPDGTQQTKQPTPFGDKFASTEGARMQMRVVDATAIDGATTKDEIDFEATFSAPEDQGEYRVVVSKPAPHGWAYPFGGGVVTNVLLHGVTGWGTRLFPTVFTYAAFWGQGEIYKDGERIVENTGVHVMLTEFARKEPYDLVFDDGVDPGNMHLHLMVLPFTAKGEPSPVPTGFMLPNGMEQPFLHVMFPAVQLESEGSSADAATPSGEPQGTPAATSSELGSQTTIEAYDELRFEPAEVTIAANTDVAVQLVNEGQAQHNFSVEELGIDVDLPAGESTETTVNAEAGEYAFYCNVAGHREAGMEGTLTVE